MSTLRQRFSVEQKFTLYGVLCALLVIAGVALFAPAQDEDDPTPSTYNAGPQGLKAAYLLLPRLGYRVQRSSDAVGQLQTADAARTTLVIPAAFGAQDEAETRVLEGFLRRGGRIVATGDFGATVLPGVYWKDGEAPAEKRCRTTPEGDSALARVGPLLFQPGVLARTDLPETHVAQRCEHGAAVIWYRMGEGTAVWWAGVAPLTNRGLHTDANLQLLLASVGPAGRTVLFDESDHPWHPASPWSAVAGLPLTAVVLQLLLAFVLALFAFSRRHGPLRTLQTTPRTSPLEFAESMGALYHRAGAGEVATQQGRRALQRMLQEQCGLSAEVAHGPAEGIAAALDERFGFRDPELRTLLESLNESDRISPARALTRVQSLHRLTGQLYQRIRTSRHRTAQETARD